MKYKGYNITQNSKRKDHYNPVSGHRWATFKPIEKSFSVTGYMAFSSYVFKSITRAKEYVDTLIRINQRMTEQGLM